MIPRIVPEHTIEPLYAAYLKQLCTQFSGEIRADYAARLTAATDNSIYQVIPEAIILPRSTQDIANALKLSQDDNFRAIKFAPRGGGTATNGQSLSAGIIIDCSKYLCNIPEINLDEKWVRVQSGVVLDQLNQYLRPMGVHFAPEISTSNRATIGGMINTDACGNGSKIIGRTSDHVISLTCILANGKIFDTSIDEIEYAQEITNLLKKNQELIREKFTSAPRTLCGYNLAKAYQGNLDLNYLLGGSEGTLAIISECKLKLTSIPKFKKLLVIKYKKLDDALQAKEITDDIHPQVIEVIDEKLLELARTDGIYPLIKEFIKGANVITLVEFRSDNKDEMERRIKKLCANIQKSPRTVGYHAAENNHEIKLLWELRKKSVGLISKKQDQTRRPIPFIEDTAVPPEKLADYIRDFKTLLDRYRLVYGMYGHLDAGCVHVRPALDTRLPYDEKLIRTLSDQVVLLVKKYGGVIWGEHGKGFRSEYGIDFFGEELFLVLRKIKTFFDPYNQLNPGKIATPIDSSEKLVSLNGPLRGHFDKQIPVEISVEYVSAMNCNGNGACFNFDTRDVMCPSFKVTKDRIHSPKGRAILIREWLRQLARQHYFFSKSKSVSIFSKWLFHKKPDFSHEVFAALEGCLSCKACVTQCPLGVDVPGFKTTFLSHYYKRYQRPLRDYFIAKSESIAKIHAKVPRLANWISRRWISRFLLKKILKMIDPPQAVIHSFRLKTASLAKLSTIPENQKTDSVIIIQDAFTSFYEKNILQACYEFFSLIGLSVYIVPFFSNGKPLHVKGFLNRFDRVARKNIHYLKKLAELNIPLVGIDPAMTLTYRDEYKKISGEEKLDFHVLLPQEFLQKNISRLKKTTPVEDYYLLSHCTEKTALPDSEKKWQTIFFACGLNLSVLPAGCCGMAGSYGHEAENEHRSRALFQMDWDTYLHETPRAEHSLLATGYSCRSQALRFANIKLNHPLIALVEKFKRETT